MPARRLVQAVGLMVALALAIVVVIKWAPVWLASGDGLTAEQRAADVGRVRTALLTALAGLIAVIGAYYTSRTFALNRQGQITERFTRAIDQLGSQVLDVKLGGIYALERLARESRDDYGPIVEILAAYVRDHAPLEVRGAKVNAKTRDGVTKPTTDVQAALTVLARRSIDHGAGPTLDLSFTALSGVQLRDAHLEGANLRGAQLAGAELSRAHLQKAILAGANLETARNLDDANLQGAMYDAETAWPKDFDPLAKGAMKMGVRRRMVLCCDGTWTRPEVMAGGMVLGRHPSTNVAKIAAAIAPADSEETPQILFYLPGGGRGLFGLSRETLDCYRFIVENYEPKDDLFLFGFSRGAYTARSVAGLVRTAGILRREHIDRIKDAYSLYRSRSVNATPNGIEAQMFRGIYSLPETDITFIGVWDTVGALGIPTGAMRPPFIARRWQFHDVVLSPHVRYAYQALAIDEHRRAFEPTRWEQYRVTPAQTLEQVWFAGSHADVGGGYADSALSDITLLWMVDRAREAGLAFRPDRLKPWEEFNPREDVLQLNPELAMASGAVVAPDALGQVHESRIGIGRLFRRQYRRPLEGVDGGAVARTAIQRWKRIPGYRPPTLGQYVDSADGS